MKCSFLKCSCRPRVKFGRHDHDSMWSDQSKYVRVQVMRIRLKNSKQLLVSGHFSLCENQRFSPVLRFQAQVHSEVLCGQETDESGKIG